MWRIAIVVALVCGCHHEKPGRTVVTDTSIEILGPLRFADQSVEIDATGMKLLDAVAETLVGNPSILIVSVHGYGSGAPPEGRQQLADQRTDVIMKYLVAHGVESSRLQAGGVGDPPAPDAGVGFEILKRKP
jgi:outer membrane protein OmpA-like peptidoglycan-associated protein